MPYFQIISAAKFKLMNIRLQCLFLCKFLLYKVDNQDKIFNLPPTNENEGTSILPPTSLFTVFNIAHIKKD